MSLSQSELLQRRLDAMNKYIHRAKTRDSSELTFIKQARAGSVESPQQVQGVTERNGLAYNVTIEGKGVNMEYGGKLLAAQGCAVCSDVDPVTNPGITIPGCSTATVTSSYTAPCRVPGYQVFFPPPLADGKNCNYNRTWYGS